MIRVEKSSDAPSILTDKGMPETDENKRLYEANPATYDSGATKFKIQATIYGDTSVKEQLIDEQYGKCCFCEADFTANGYGDVEHFRPKAGYTEKRTSKLIRPGYYWLAYNWDNLFFSCQICNQRFKKNYFPLENEAQRAKNHTIDYRDETPVLLHPSVDEPADHITFNRHVPVAKTNRGKISITGFGIDRPELNRAREAYLQNVRNNDALAKVNLGQLTDDDRDHYSSVMNQPWPVLEGLILTAKVFMEKAAKDTTPFAAMIRANFPELV
jgi:uncharacterized protein (TIGR02646 family)